MSEEISRTKIHELAIVSVMTAMLCALGPMSVPIGPVPISLATFVIYLSLFVVGTKRTLCAVFLYIILGAAGLPVLAGYSGGIAKIVGPTGGYIAGYFVMAASSGPIIDSRRSRVVKIAALVLGTAILYAIGTAYFMLVTGMGLGASAALCVWPFIPGDLLKIVAASHVGPIIRTRVDRIISRK